MKIIIPWLLANSSITLIAGIIFAAKGNVDTAGFLMLGCFGFIVTVFVLQVWND